MTEIEDPPPVVVFTYPQGYLVGDAEIARAMPWHERGLQVEFRWPDGKLCVLVPPGLGYFTWHGRRDK